MTKISFDYVNKLNPPFIDKYEIIKNVRVLRFKGSIDSETVPKNLGIKKEIDWYLNLRKRRWKN